MLGVLLAQSETIKGLWSGHKNTTARDKLALNLSMGLRNGFPGCTT